MLRGSKCVMRNRQWTAGVAGSHTVRPWHPRVCVEAAQAVTRAGGRAAAGLLHRTAADRPPAGVGPPTGGRRLAGTAWTNEVIGGKDALVQLAVLFAATERMAFGTGIANIWARHPQTMHGAAVLLAQASPAGWCSASASATRSRRPAPAWSSAARWPPCATTWNG